MYNMTPLNFHWTIPLNASTVKCKQLYMTKTSDLNQPSVASTFPLLNSPDLSKSVLIFSYLYSHSRPLFTCTNLSYVASTVVAYSKLFWTLLTIFCWALGTGFRWAIVTFPDSTCLLYWTKKMQRGLCFSPAMCTSRPYVCVHDAFMCLRWEAGLGNLGDILEASVDPTYRKNAASDNQYSSSETWDQNCRIYICACAGSHIDDSCTCSETLKTKYCIWICIFAHITLSLPLPPQEHNAGYNCGKVFKCENIDSTIRGFSLLLCVLSSNFIKQCTRRCFFSFFFMIFYSSLYIEPEFRGYCCETS
jgi:hypothetical protein